MYFDMKKLFFVFCLFCIVSTYANARGINGYYTIMYEGSHSELILDGDRDYTEIGVKSGNMVEIRITKPSSPNCTWELTDNNTNSQAFQSGSDFIYIQVPKIYEFGRSFMLNIRSGENFLSVRVYLIP